MSSSMMRRTPGTSRVSGDAHRHIAGWRWARHTPPWLGTSATLALALAFRNASWGADTLFERVAALVLLAIATWVLLTVAAQYARPRFPFVATHLRWTIVTLSVLFGVTVLIGAPVAWCWIAGAASITLCLSWNLRSTDVLRSHDHEEKGQKEQSAWDRIGLGDFEPKVIENNASRVVLSVKGKMGKGAGDLIRLAGPLGNMLEARPGSVQVVRSPEASNRARVIVNKIDHLSIPTPRPGWDGRYHSIADGIPIGVYEDGTVLNAWLAGKSGQAPTLLQVMGMTRSGKSHLFRLFAWGFSECHDVVLWVSDTVKSSQTLWPLLPAIDRLESGKDGAGTRRMILDVQNIITWRSNYLGNEGLDDTALRYRRRFLADDERPDAWKPGCGLSLLVVWLEEAARVLPNSTAWTRVCESGLSTGVVPIDSMQRADFSNKPTGARSQVASGICFGVNDAGDSSFVLGPTAQEASQLDLWKTRYPGRFLADCMFADPDRISLPLVTFWSDTIVKDAERAIAVNGPRMARLTDWEVNMCSTPYVRPADTSSGRVTVEVSVRPEGAPSGRTDGRTAVTGSLADAVRTATDDDLDRLDGVPITEDMIDEIDPDGRQDPSVRPDPTDVQLEAALSVEDGQPLPGPCSPGEGWQLHIEDGGRLSPEEAHARFVDVLCHVWEESKRMTRENYRIIQRMDLVTAYGPYRSRPWIQERLNTLAEKNMATALGGGRWAILVDPREATVPVTECVESDDSPSDLLFADSGDPADSDGASA